MNAPKMPMKGELNAPAVPPKMKSLDLLSRGKTGLPFGDSKAKGGTLLPPPAPLKTGISMPFMKKSASLKEGPGMNAPKMPMKGELNAPAVPPKMKSLDLLSKGKSGLPFGDSKAKGGTSLPPPAPLKTGISMPFMKKSAGLKEGSGMNAPKVPMKGELNAPAVPPKMKSLDSLSKGKTGLPFGDSKTKDGTSLPP